MITVHFMLFALSFRAAELGRNGMQPVAHWRVQGEPQQTGECTIEFPEDG
jgi:hypothetical protein